MTTYTPYSYGFNANSTCNIEITMTGKQNYSGNLTGNNPWDCYIYFDGQQVAHVWGSGAVTDNLICKGVVTGVGAGAHTVSVNWVCTSSYITLQNTAFSMLTTNK